MKIKHSEIEVPKDGSDPFVNCKLDRKQYAAVLTNIVESYGDGFVLAINNKWGTGKTTFVKMWQQHLINEGFQTLYFNAWENDFQKEVIIALLSELSELRNKGEATFNSLVEKGATFLKKVAPAVVKGVASKALGNEAITDIVAAAAEFTTEELENEIQSFTEAKKGIIDFRASLEKFVADVNNENPVVFIIDELDRCRPNYAVTVLEEIKHLFSVSGIIFVLSIDKEQLGHAVKGVYGSDLINSDEYLRRFIDLEYNIPSPNRQLFIEYLLDYYDFDSFVKLPSRLQSGEFKNDGSTLRTISKMLFSQGEFNLRLIEKCFARIRLTIQTFSENQFIFPEIVVLLSYLYEKYPYVYRKVETSEYTVQEFVDVFDSIFEPFNNSADARRMLFLYGSLLNKYYRQVAGLHRNHQVDLLIRDVSNGDVSLGVQSKLEDPNKNLANTVNHHQSQFNTSDIDLAFIQKRYSLSQNLQ